MAVSYKKSASGRYGVTLSKPFERRKFIYKPGTSITVSKELLDEMIAADAVSNVVSSD